MSSERQYHLAIFATGSDQQEIPNVIASGDDVFDSAHRDRVRIVAPLPRPLMDSRKVGPVGEFIVRGQHRSTFYPPQLIGACPDD